VNYDEAVSGDLTPSSAPYFALDVGVNTITGTTSWPYPGSSDYDFMLLVLPQSHKITNISLHILSSSVDQGRLAWTIFDDSTAGGGQLASGAVMNNCCTPWYFTTPSYPISAVNGGVFSAYVGMDAKGSFLSPSANYQFAITVATIPVPSALWLFGGALTALGAMRRRVGTSPG
jgi:hypothetical protein